MTSESLLSGLEKFLIVGILYLLYLVRKKNDRKEVITQEVERWHELKDFHVVGFCKSKSCLKQTRLSHHCDGCGGHDRHNIITHIVRNGGEDHVCTRCFHLARYSHHCDCGGRISDIVSVH